MHSTTKRLILQQDQCLVLQPEVVKQLGRSAAIFLQQLHYWISSDNNVGRIIDQKKWVYNSTKSWAENIKILSEATVKRSISILKNLGIVQSANLNNKKSDKTLWYTIDYTRLKNIFLFKNCSTGTFSSFQNKYKSSFYYPVKMSCSLDQNDHLINKETEITSENKPISSEAAAFEKQEKSSQQVNVVKKEISFENRNNLATELLEIWNQTVGEGGAPAHLTKKRAQHLVAAFKFKFESNFEMWKKFCKQITTSDFLMGKIKETFKARLDWVLKFETIQRILEGDFDIRDLSKTDKVSSDSSEKSHLEEVVTEIDSGNETIEAKELRRKILHKLGTAYYQTWFRDLSIQLDQEGRGLQLWARSLFVKEYIETHYIDKIKCLSSQGIHIFCA